MSDVSAAHVFREASLATVFPARASQSYAIHQGGRTGRAFAEVLQHGKVVEELVECLSILRSLPCSATNAEIFLRIWNGYMVTGSRLTSRCTVEHVQ